jgi:hypothetical protein
MLQRITFKPGVNRDQTNYAGEGGFFECDKIRFRSGFPQKIGGWARTGIFTLVGICRQMFNYITSFSDNILVLGTSAKLYLEVGTNLINITPLRAVNPTYTTPATDNCVGTINGQTGVTITITGCVPVVGNYVEISGVVGPVNGIPASEINGNREIFTAPDNNSFPIATTTAATSTATGGGTAITVSFEITVGDTSTTYGYGWGTGGWGAEAWGTSGLTPVTIFQRDWWIDNFDHDIVANVRHSSI